MALDEGQVITYAIDEIVKTFTELYLLTDKVQHYQPDPGSMQRSSNIYWKPIQQHGHIIEGWDISGPGADDILELSISGSLDEPTNTFRTLRMDDLRDETSYRRAIRADAMRLVGDMESKGLTKAATLGSFCITKSEVFGPDTGQVPVWDILAEAETRMFDTEMYTDAGTISFLNGTTYVAGGKALVEGAANRSNVIQDEAYRDGKIQNQVAGFGEVYRHNKLINYPAAAGAALTINGTVSLKPLANEALANGSKGNVDNRFGDITVTGSTAAVVVGDKFKFADVKAISLGEKVVQEYDQTFTIAAINGQVLTISPRPMAFDDASLTDLEKEYTNINTQIVDTDALVYLNTTTRKSNVVMTQDSMVLTSSPIPFNHELFQDLNARSFSVGPINGLIGFESQLDKLTGFYRIAIWYDWQIEKPMEIGIILDNQA